jgi:hypothetical protein
MLRYTRPIVVEITHCNPIAFRGHLHSRNAMPSDLTIPARVEAGVSFGPLNAGPSRGWSYGGHGGGFTAVTPCEIIDDMGYDIFGGIYSLTSSRC